MKRELRLHTSPAKDPCTTGPKGAALVWCKLDAREAGAAQGGLGVWSMGDRGFAGDVLAANTAPRRVILNGTTGGRDGDLGKPCRFDV